MQKKKKELLLLKLIIWKSHQTFNLWENEVMRAKAKERAREKKEEKRRTFNIPVFHIFFGIALILAKKSKMIN